jgi:hypothetical protein
MNEKENTAALLSAIHKNVMLGCDNIAAVVPMIEDKFLMTNVTAQLEHYSELRSRAESEMDKYGIRPQRLSMYEKLRTRAGIMASTVFDSSDAHIAEMIERGTRRGADELERTMTSAGQGVCDEASMRLCKSVIDFERREADRVRDFT